MELEHLKQIQQFSCGDEPLMLVLSRVGNAKRVLLDNACDTIKVEKPVIFLDGKDHLKPHDVITALSWQWQIDVTGSGASLEDQLQALLNVLQQQKKASVLIVDDAHLLPFSILTALIQTATLQIEQCHLHLILAGRESLKDKVASLYERPISTIELNTLTHQIVEQTVQHFLEEKNIQAPTPTVTHISDRMFTQARGNPQQLHTLMRALTVKDFLDIPRVRSKVESKKVLKHRIVGRNGARATALVGLVVTLFGLYWYKHHPYFTSTPRMPSKPYHYQMVQNVPLTHPQAKASQKFYTIQLMGSFNQAQAKYYIASHHLSQKAQVYTQQFHHKPWYIVGVGHYAKPTQAKTDLNQIEIKNAWIRPIHSD